MNPELDITRPFLESVLPTLQGDERYWAEAFASKSGPVSRVSLRVKDLAAFFEKHAAGADVYFSPVAFKSAGKGRKGNNVVRCRVVWADLDVGPGKEHATVADAISALKTFPLKPTWVISSGRGIHVYWLLVEEVEEDDFPRLMAVVRGLALHLGGDLAATLRTQILRPPGTLNHKPGGPYPVEVMHHFSDAPELSLDDFEEYITPDPEPAFREREGNKERGEWDGPPANLERIVKGCAWLRHARDDATRLAEPEWYAMLSIVARSDGGEDAAHEWSRPHPGYSARETDAKIHHALESAGPRTCEAIRADFGADWCNGCAFKDRVKSPIQIGSGGFADRSGGQVWTWGKDEQARAPQPSRFRILSRNEFLALPEPDWLVQGVIPRPGTGLVYSPSGLGKSFERLHLAACIATGTAWFGREVVQGDVLYIACEGQTGFKKRLLAWEHYYGIKAERLSWLADAPQLMKVDEVESLLEELARAGVHPALIVVDTLSRSLVGGDENSAKDVGLYLASMERLKASTGAHVSVVHHTGHNTQDRPRGSSTIMPAVDTLIALHGDPTTHELQLVCEKQKDAAEFAPIALRLIVHGDSLVAVASESSTAGTGATEQTLLEVLSDAGEEGLSTSAWMRALPGIPPRSFHRSRKKLLDKKLIENGGTTARTRWINSAKPPPETPPQGQSEEEGETGSVPHSANSQRGPLESNSANSANSANGTMAPSAKNSAIVPTPVGVAPLAPLPLAPFVAAVSTPELTEVDFPERCGDLCRGEGCSTCAAGAAVAARKAVAS